MDERNKKILFVITKGNFGGAQKYVFDLATRLRKSNFDTTVACGEGEELPNKLREQNIEVLKIENLRRDIKTMSEIRVCQELVQMVRKVRPDIVHLNSSKIGGIGAVAVWIAKLTSKNYHPQIIFTAHNWGFNEFWRSPISRLFFYISHWVTILLCDKVIVVANKIRLDMAWAPLATEKMVVVHNGVGTTEMVERPKARAFLSGSSDCSKQIILSISELHPTKGLDVALKAIALLPQAKREQILYCIAGSGEWSDKLQNDVIKLKLTEHVRFLGFVADAPQYLLGADIFLLPSRNEAFPYAILEAGLAGLPVIATSVGGIPEVLEDMQNGILVHKENKKEINEGISYLLEHPEKRSEFGAEIKRKVIEYFSIEKMLEQTIAVYKS